MNVAAPCAALLPSLRRAQVTNKIPKKKVSIQRVLVWRLNKIGENKKDWDKISGTLIMFQGLSQKMGTNGYLKETWLFLLANLETLDKKYLFTLLDYLWFLGHSANSLEA